MFSSTLRDIDGYTEPEECGATPEENSIIKVKHYSRYCDVVISNDSGCSGAAVTRGKEGETVPRITTVFPFWFCKNYYKYANNEDTMPFDQHFFIAANHPQNSEVASPFLPAEPGSPSPKAAALAPSASTLP